MLVKLTPKRNVICDGFPIFAGVEVPGEPEDEAEEHFKLYIKKKVILKWRHYKLVFFCPWMTSRLQEVGMGLWSYSEAGFVLVSNMAQDIWKKYKESRG